MMCGPTVRAALSFPPLASVGDREDVRTPGNSEPKVTGVAQCAAER